MSNGVGGTTTESSHKFQHKQADHPFISFERVYASVFSTMSYYRREEIENDIIFASVNASNLQVGDVFKNVHMKNRTWNAVYLGTRSEERRVGKECVSPFRYRWSPSQ